MPAPMQAVMLFAALIGPSASGATECRRITRSTVIETIHPNGAVSTGRVDEGERFIVIGCRTEGTQVWCSIQETARPVFTLRRFLDADRLDAGISEAVDFDECLAPDQ